MCISFLYSTSVGYDDWLPSGSAFICMHNGRSWVVSNRNAIIMQHFIFGNLINEIKLHTTEKISTVMEHQKNSKL